MTKKRAEQLLAARTKKEMSRKGKRKRGNSPDVIRAVLVLKNMNVPVCEHCWSTHNVQLHHLDGNWRNNDLSNFQFLCSTHHLQVHGGSFKNSPKSKYLTKEIKMKMTEWYGADEATCKKTLEAWHRCNKEHQIYSPSNNRARLRTQSGAAIGLTGLSEISDTQIFLDVLGRMNGKPEHYKEVMDCLDNLNKADPVKDGVGKNIKDFYWTGKKEKTKSRRYQKLFSESKIKNNSSKENTTKNGDVDVNLATPAITGSCLDAVKEDPSRAEAAAWVLLAVHVQPKAA